MTKITIFTVNLEEKQKQIDSVCLNDTKVVNLYNLKHIKCNLKMKIEVQKALLSDLSTIENIYDYAREWMIKNNNTTQWALNYPSTETIKKDINSGFCYKCLLDNDLIAVFCLIPGEDPTYNKIEQGSWLNHLPYSTVHRLASNGKINGIGTFILKWCLNRDKNIRVDTHEKNFAMLRILQNTNFKRCGIIYATDGTKRIAFQKKI